MKKVAFLTGTRADFGKIKPLFKSLQDSEDFEAHIFVTGMHMIAAYGFTKIEVERAGFRNIHTFSNQTSEETMDLTLAKTIQGFSAFVKNIEPDMIVVHGDRVEALAGALVGSLNNILVAHIEGGEISGTIDELIRHSTSKMSHIHFVSNAAANNRLIQMGELPESIKTIGSPDVDIMFSEDLPDLKTVKVYYEIPFNEFAVVLFHPVTTEVSEIRKQAEALTTALLKSQKDYVVIYPNNDLGSSQILETYKILKGNGHFRVIPSMRFEYFLTLLKNAECIVGNSSAGIREAPYYGIPTINIGTRQENRALHSHMNNVDYSVAAILEALEAPMEKVPVIEHHYGDGKSAERFLKSLQDEKIWQLNHQKQFRDM